MRKRFPFICSIILRPEVPESAVSKQFSENLKRLLPLEDFPLVWNLPEGSLVPGLPDAELLSTGKRGLPHPLLEENELKEELLCTADGENPIYRYIFPAIPDPYRATATELYEKRKRMLLDCGKEIVLIGDTGKSGFIHIPVATLYASRKETARFKKIIKQARQDQKPALITIRAPEEALLENLLVIRQILTRTKSAPLSFDDLLRVTAPASSSKLSLTAIPGSALPLQGDPLHRHQRTVLWSKPTESRLLHIAGRLSTQVEGAPDMAGVPRDLIANMPGEVLMYEGSLKALFNVGDLKRLGCNGCEGPLVQHCSPFFNCSRRVVSGKEVTTADEPITMHRVSSFSFEGDMARGMRDSVLIKSPVFAAPGRLIRDYFFIEGEDRLCVSCFVTYPQIEEKSLQVESYGFFEIPIASNNDGCFDFIAEYPDGNIGRGTLIEEGNYLIYGTRFSFPGPQGTLSLEFGDAQSAVREISLSVRDGSLRINPCGSYTSFPGTRLSGIREQFSLILGMDSSIEEAGKAALLPHLESHRIFVEPQHHQDSGNSIISPENISR